MAVPGTPERHSGRYTRPTTVAWRRWVVRGIVAALLVAATVIVLRDPARPIPGHLAVASIGFDEASVRLAMVRERQRVEAFQQREGRLPVTLHEAGATSSVLGYTVRPDGSYALEGSVGRSRIVLHSTSSVEAFLGNSLEVILSRPTP